MRISDHRYRRDRERFDLAMRFMQHEARTHTIREWTGLSDDRIRKLYKDYLSDSPGSASRHRGKSPGQASFFFRTSRVQQEAATLASLFCILGALPRQFTSASQVQPGISRGQRLCQAFEAYVMMVSTSQISFEHAVLLINELARGEELRLGACVRCHAVLVVDRLALGDVHCGRCTEAPQTGC